MFKTKAYYTIETTMVMSVIIIMIFSAITYTLELYEKVVDYGIVCLTETERCGGFSDMMRLERLMSGFDK